MLPPTVHGRTALLVLGMHRSGTSAVAGVLGALGGTLPRDSIGATADNARGYFESRAVVAADDRLIRTLQSSWFDPRPLDVPRLSIDAIRAHRADMRAAVDTGFGEALLVVLKDPRQCRFVPFVADALAEAGIACRAVLVLRDPREVAASLCARDATIPPYGALLWLRHMIDAERDTRAMPRVLIDYATLLDDPRDGIGRLASIVGGSDDRAGEDAARAFLDPLLRRRREGDTELSGPIAALAATAWQAFRDLHRHDGPIERARIDAVAAEFAAAMWLEGDIVHDELRHRRAPAVPPIAAPQSLPAPVPEAPHPTDVEETIRTIRDSGLFDADYYRDRYPDVRESGIDPIRHYVETGAPEGRDPSAHFNTAYYSRQMARRRGPRP